MNPSKKNGFFSLGGLAPFPSSHGADLVFTFTSLAALRKPARYSGTEAENNRSDAEFVFDDVRHVSWHVRKFEGPKKNKMDRDVQSRPLALAVAPGAVVTVVKCTSQQGVKINPEVRMGQFG